MDNNEASNDVMSVASSDTLASAGISDDNDKPLMKLFKRLIGNDNKQNTVLTNAQIIDILSKEFDMDMSYHHDLETEVYLNLMKKFLKDWPQWDDFDKAIQLLKTNTEETDHQEMLMTNYENLKIYLSKMLATAAPMLDNVMKEIREDRSIASGKKTIDEDVVLEVHCTRSQLNQLFFRRPHPDYNNTIFNVELGPAKITAQMFNLDAMLNWPDFRININLSSLSLYRDTKHVLKHILINKYLNHTEEEPTELKTNLQEKFGKVKTRTTFTMLIERINEIATASTNYAFRAFAEHVCNLIKFDLANAQENIKIPTRFRRNMQKYPYVRCLNTDVKTSQYVSNKYDLYLRETMIPQVFIHLAKFENSQGDIPEDGNWLKIDCVICNVSFSGLDIASDLKMHFIEYHQYEMSWKCTKCKTEFYAIRLAENKWQHNCK